MKYCLPIVGADKIPCNRNDRRCVSNANQRKSAKRGQCEYRLRAYLARVFAGTSSDLTEPFDPICKRHFSASCFSSLQNCRLAQHLSTSYLVRAYSFTIFGLSFFSVFGLLLRSDDTKQLKRAPILKSIPAMPLVFLYG